MRKAAIGAVMVALIGAVAGTYCKPDLRSPGPGPTLVVTQPPPEAEADRFWAGSTTAYSYEGYEG